MFSSRSVRLLLFFLGASLLATQAEAQAPVGDVLASDASVKGSVTLSAASTRVMSGSSVTAGASNASIRLLRGGELRVCQGSSVSLTTSPKGNAILVSMSSGTIEAHYPLSNVRDAVMTPDFEIFLNGPGVFHLAISADDHGNTCVQTQHGNAGTVTVSELMGDGSYTLKPEEQLIFRGGRASNPGQVVASCGCPPAIPVQSASAAPPKPVTNPAASPPPPVASLIESSPEAAKLTAPLPADRPGDVHVQVEAPFVFRASDAQTLATTPVALAEIRLSTLPAIPPLSIQSPPGTPAQAANQQIAEEKPRKKKRHGLWGFLASIFKG